MKSCASHKTAPLVHRGGESVSGLTDGTDGTGGERRATAYRTGEPTCPTEKYRRPDHGSSQRQLSSQRQVSSVPAPHAPAAARPQPQAAAPRGGAAKPVPA